MTTCKLTIDADPFALAINAPQRFQERYGASADAYLKRFGYDPEGLRRNAVSLVMHGRLARPRQTARKAAPPQPSTADTSPVVSELASVTADLESLETACVAGPGFTPHTDRKARPLRRKAEQLQTKID